MKISNWGMFFAIGITLAIGIFIGKYGSATTVHDVGYVVKQCDDCDYITPNLTYHGWCQTTNDLLNLDKQRKDMEQAFTTRLNDTLSYYCPMWLEEQQQAQAACISGCKMLAR